MQVNTDLVLNRYLEKIIQENRAINARGVMQVNRMIELSMEDVFIHLTVRMNHSDIQSSLQDPGKLQGVLLESEDGDFYSPDSLSTRKSMPHASESLGQTYIETFAKPLNPKTTGENLKFQFCFPGFL